MATITSLDKQIAGSQPPCFYIKYESTGAGINGGYYDMWSYPGIPGPGTYDTTLNGVTCDNTTAGCIPFTNPAAGKQTLLQRFTQNQTLATGTACATKLVDRLWHNGGIDATITTAQNITSPTWPARDNNGSTNGEGIMIAVVLSVIGAINGGAVITISYTNSAGTSGKTATNNPSPGTVWGSIPLNANKFRFQPLCLATGDKGVRSVQSVTLGGAGDSTTKLNLVAYRPIAFCPSWNAQTAFECDILQMGAQRIFDSSCLQFVGVQFSAINSVHNGLVSWTQG